MSFPPSSVNNRSKLAQQDREQLLSTARRLLAEAEALSSRIAAVNEIGIAINRTHDLDEILQVVARQAKWLLDFDHCSVCLQQSEKRRLVTLFGSALDDVNEVRIDESEIGQVFKTGQSRLIREADASRCFKEYASQIIIPLASSGEVMGTINFFRREAMTYTQEDLRVGYLLALQLSSAIRNAEHFQEMKEAEAELRRYAEELEARNQELDAYSHTIAHDLKAPVSSILLKTYLINKIAGDQLPEKARQNLSDIDSSAKHMTDMIDQLLWLAKLRDVAETAMTVDMKATAKNALSRYRDAIVSSAITIDMAEMPNAQGHAQWIEEVFANLIGNAIKYMGNKAERRICIRGVRQGDIVRYEVQDSGIGIAPEDQARLFEMFTRLNKVNVEGLGLGLSIVQRIVTRLNGTLGVESTPGQGSTFWFTLPTNGL